jgi:hypothetical protein
VKSLKRFDLNLNLKGCFKKGLKKKKKKRNSPRLPFGPVAQQPINTSPAAAHDRHLFFFFLSFADDPATGQWLPSPSFLLPPPLPRPVRRRRDPRRALPLPFPFLLARAGQLRRHFLAFKSGCLPFPPVLPEMHAAFNGKRRPPLAPSASPPFPLSRLLFKVEPKLLLAPLLSHCKHTRLSIPFTIAATSVRSLPPCHRRRR